MVRFFSPSFSHLSDLVASAFFPLVADLPDSPTCTQLRSHSISRAKDHPQLPCSILFWLLPVGLSGSNRKPGNGTPPPSIVAPLLRRWARHPLPHHQVWYLVPQDALHSPQLLSSSSPHPKQKSPPRITSYGAAALLPPASSPPCPSLSRIRPSSTVRPQSSSTSTHPAGNSRLLAMCLMECGRGRLKVGVFLFKVDGTQGVMCRLP